MRENRPYGSEGGGIELNRSFLPLSAEGTSGSFSSPPPYFNRSFASGLFRNPFPPHNQRLSRNKIPTSRIFDTSRHRTACGFHFPVDRPVHRDTY